MEKIAVVDFGGQYTHLEARRIRQLGVYSEIVSPQVKPEELKGYNGIILSGGPSSVYDKGAPVCDPAILEIGIPVLGLCYGHQLLSRTLGGEVKPGKVQEFGPASLSPDMGHPLFQGVKSHTEVWMSHGDEVAKLPMGFRAIGSTSDCANAAVANDERKFYGLQFHPEVTYQMICRWTVKAGDRMGSPGAQPPHLHRQGWHQHDRALARWSRDLLARWAAGFDNRTNAPDVVSIRQHERPVDLVF